MKYLVSALFVFILLINTSSFGQEQILAKIGDLELSAKEFKQRFELTPKIKSDFDSTKANFLYSLIAEKLWALEAQSLSMDTIPYVYNSVKDIERKLVKDKLYKIEVENKVVITEKEIDENLFKIDEKRTMNFLFSKDKSEIEFLYNRLFSKEPFDSIVVERVEQNQQIDGVPVVFGQMDEHLENIIYSLELNKFTEPIPVKVGWVIYYLKSVEYNQFEIGENKNAKRKKVEEILFARKAKNFYREFLKNNILGVTVLTEKRLLNYLVDEIFKMFVKKGEYPFNESTKEFELDAVQLKSLKGMFADRDLLSDFIKFKISPISFENYILSLELNGFSCKKRSKGEIYNALNSNIKSYIFEELLFREGFSRGLQNSEEIKSELKIWRESFLASYYKYSFLDSVKIDDSEVKEYYNKVVSENDSLISKPYSTVKEKIKSGFYFHELENLFIDKTVNLTTKYKVSVNTEVLSLIEVTDIEMMVYRLLGFGGEIAAAPYLQSFYKWKNWLPKSLKKSLP